MIKVYTASQISKNNLFNTKNYQEVLKIIRNNKDILQPTIVGDKKGGKRIYVKEENIKRYLEKKED